MTKRECRAETAKLISALDCEYISESDRLIFENLKAMPEFNAARRVFLYLSINREPDTRRIINHCISCGIPFALPRTFSDGRMDFCLVDDLSLLAPKPPYGIPEPPDSFPPTRPDCRDVIIVPGLCYDEGLYRLGHGKGYYDRFLTDCPAYTVGLCREKLMLPCLPVESHDVPVACLVTEVKLRNRDGSARSSY